MIQKSRGIVLQHFNYSESSVIARIFTEEFGLRSYMIKGARGKKRKKSSFLLPLSVVSLTAYHKEGRDLHLMKSLDMELLFKNIPYDIRKTTIALFLGEFLFKSLKEESPDHELFAFLLSNLQLLDLEENPSCVHLFFLARLTSFFGITPGQGSEKKQYFDLQNSEFLDYEPSHDLFMDIPTTDHFKSLLSNNSTNIKIPGNIKTNLLENLILYFRLNLDGIGELKSHQVLKEVFHET